MAYIAPNKKPPDHAFIAEVDAFMAKTKELYGVEDVQDYQRAREKGQWEVDYPIMVDGEFSGKSLRVVTHPYEKPVVWSLVLIWPPAISRLDWDELGGHSNKPRIKNETHPATVEGPHIHPWGLNRRFMKSRKTTEPIPLAVPIPDGMNFDKCLHWFCDENKIFLPQNHRIQLMDKPELF